MPTVTDNTLYIEKLCRRSRYIDRAVAVSKVVKNAEVWDHIDFYRKYIQECDIDHSVTPLQAKVLSDMGLDPVYYVTIKTNHDAPRVISIHDIKMQVLTHLVSSEDNYG